MKKLLAPVLALLTFCTLLTHATGEEGTNTLRLLLPYHIGWVEDAAAMYEEQTGVQVTIDTTLTGETEIYGPGKSQKTLNILRENLAAAVESGKYDLVYSWAVPAELMTRPNLLINLDELAAADPEFNLSDYHSGVMSARATDAGWYTIPVCFDFNLLAVNTQKAEELGITDDMHNGMTRAEWTELCAEIKKSGKLHYGYLVADSAGSRNPDIPVAFLTEAMTFCQNRDLINNEAFQTLIEDYIAYYKTNTSRTDGSQNPFGDPSGVEFVGVDPEKMTTEEWQEFLLKWKEGTLDVGSSYVYSQPTRLTLGNLVSYESFYRELGELSESGKVSFYTCPTSQLGGIFCNVEGLSIVKSEQTEQAWDLAKFLLSEPVQRMAAERVCPVRNSVRGEAITETFADGSSILDYVDGMTRFSIYKRQHADWPNGTVYRDYAYEVAHYFVEYRFAQSLKSLGTKDYALMMASAVRKDLKLQTGAPIPWLKILLAVLYLMIIAIVAAVLFMIVMGVRTLLRRVQEIQNIRTDLYGRDIDLVKSRKAEPLLVMTFAILMIVGLAFYYPHLENLPSDVPLRVRQLLVYIFMGGAAALGVVALASALLSKIHLCEKAMVIVSGFKLQVIYTDSIERITSDSRTATVVTNYGKPTVLRTTAYKQLGEKLNEWWKGDQR